MELFIVVQFMLAVSMTIYALFLCSAYFIYSSLIEGFFIKDNHKVLISVINIVIFLYIYVFNHRGKLVALAHSYSLYF